MAGEEEPYGLPTVEELELDIDVANLPKYSDPFIQQFLTGRSALLDQEDSSRSDASFRASLSPLAAEACAIVSRIRARERKTLWAADTEMAGHVFPGMPFSLARSRMESSTLWTVIQRMPKGALLHAHFGAMTDIPWLISQALSIPGMGFRSSKPLATPAALECALVGFQFAGDGISKSHTQSIYSQSYQPGTLVPATVAASTFVATAEYPTFTSWLVSRMTITPAENLTTHHGLDHIWAKFQSTFPIISSINFYEPVFRLSLRRLFAELLADGVRWADLRAAFVFDYYRTNSTTPDKDYVAFFEAFEEELADFKASEQGKGFWGARFIWTSLRGSSSEMILQNMALCLQHKVLFPHLISAYDLVGQEDLGRTLIDVLPEIFWFRKACATTGFEIPFAFHAGECLGSGDATAKNMFDAVLLGTRRLGHAFALYKHPLLMQSIKAKSICVESCPISNEVLRLTSSVQAHPLPALIASGVQCTLSNDDPAILGGGDEARNGLSRDFWSCLQGWENLGLAGLGALAENSVRYAFYGPDQDAKAWTKDVKDGVHGDGIRGERMREWRKEWEAFCEWVVKEYAVDYGSEEEGERWEQ